ncbi:MAG: NAD(P)/FAD-dependent oxidoreductase [Desulfatirhabdiaceae bacterium]
MDKAVAKEIQMNDFDVVVVGSGTGGQTAAYDLRDAGLKVAVVEKSDRPGGTCALYGCQPKKWYDEVAETIARSRHLEGKGITLLPDADWSRIRLQKNEFTSGIPVETVNGFTDAGITFLEGEGHFLSEDTLEVDGKSVKAGYFILATGAGPMSLPIAGSGNIVTSNDFLDLETLPQRIVFVGGGFISFEFAHFAARLGSKNQKITILEVQDRPLGPFDAEMVDLLVVASREEGIEVRTGVQIDSIKKQGSELCIETGQGETLYADLIVNGAGRIPDLEKLALDAGGIDYSRRGITVDAGMRTSNPHVFAVGDCAATVQLARVADYEGHVAARNVLAKLKGGPEMTIDYGAVPSMLFTYPQYGMVGETEDTLKKQDLSYRKSFGKNLNWPTYQRVGMKHAAYKILVGADNHILGAHILSDNASGLINTLKQAMINGTSVEELYWQNIMSPYPTRESDLIYMLKPFL